ncbi:MAG: hypothetical protein JWP69_1818 [Flaviaesturariibacter sp.]|nr:hypothetical protein [Flaviaesturariibacter sp.]
MKYARILSVLALSGLLLAGCSSIAHIEKDETVNFNNYKTYAWAEQRSDDTTGKSVKVSDLTERTIRNAVNAEMAKTGWRETKAKPDVLLAYDVLVERGIREQNNPVYSQPFTRYFYNAYSRRYVPVYYPSQFLGYDREQQAVREGTITISLIDAKTDKTVWQGWTTDEVNSRNLSSKEIQAGVKSIFRKFDVAKN